MLADMVAQLAQSTSVSLTPPHLKRASTLEAVFSLRALVQSIDDILVTLDPEPADGACCPPGVGFAGERLEAFLSIASSAGLTLTSRVLVRSVAFTSALRTGRVEWGSLSKLALEELVSVLDMILDVVELVGADSACRHEERISFRILATVAPKVLADVDGMGFSEIRFHQASSAARALRAK